MLNELPRDSGYLKQLARFLEIEYGFYGMTIAPAKRGWYGETWDVRHAAGHAFVKIVYFKSHQPRFRRSFPVVRWMLAHGAQGIVRPIAAQSGAECLEFMGGALGTFEYVDGEHTEDYPLEALFMRLAGNYRALDVTPLQTGAAGIDIDRERFSAWRALDFEQNLEKVRALPYPSAREVVRLLDSDRPRRSHYEARLAAFAEAMQAMPHTMHITSGDVGGNVIVSSRAFTIIDWDYPMLAPVERDTWMYMYNPRQIDILNAVLHRFGLAPARDAALAFYAYDAYFYYLTEYLKSFLDCEIDAHREKTEAHRVEISLGIRDYLGDTYWVYQNLSLADTYAL